MGHPQLTVNTHLDWSARNQLSPLPLPSNRERPSWRMLVGWVREPNTLTLIPSSSVGVSQRAATGHLCHVITWGSLVW